MKKYFKFHFFFYIVSFILLLSGHFKPYIMIMGITLFHELGHIIMGKIFKWEILKIVILPFGCITYFKIDLNVKLKEEFLVTIMGPIFQMIGATIYYYFTKDDNSWMTEAFGSDPFEDFREIQDFELADPQAYLAGEIDLENCKIIYTNLRFLSESQAADERL